MFGIDDALVATAISSAASYMGASERNRSQEAQAGRQMEFQERMSNTAYQRAVSDMQRAGLNPMLAYSQGGATTPSGAQAAIEDTLTPAVHSGREAYRAVTESGVRSAQVADIKASAGLKTAQTGESAARTHEAESHAALNAELAAKARQDTFTSASSANLMDTQGRHILASIEKIAPEIKQIVSQTHLNDASRRKLLAELPLISSQIVKNRAETEESYQRRLLLGVQTRIESLKQNEGQAYADFYGSSYGHAAPYVHSGTKAFSDVAGSISPFGWLFRPK